jgi:hypothetical protein
VAVGIAGREGGAHAQTVRRSPPRMVEA